MSHFDNDLQSCNAHFIIFSRVKTGKPVPVRHLPDPTRTRGYGYTRSPLIFCAVVTWVGHTVAVTGTSKSKFKIDHLSHITYRIVRNKISFRIDKYGLKYTLRRSSIYRRIAIQNVNKRMTASYCADNLRMSRLATAPISTQFIYRIIVSEPVLR